MKQSQYLTLSLLASAACSSGATDPSPVATSTAALDIANGSWGDAAAEHHPDESCGLPAGLAALPGYSICIWAQGCRVEKVVLGPLAQRIAEAALGRPTASGWSKNGAP